MHCWKIGTTGYEPLGCIGTRAATGVGRGKQRLAWAAEQDGQIVTWLWTRTELAPAIERRTREGSLSRMQCRQVLARLDSLAESWDEVADAVAVRSRAANLLARHPIRAADAGQLGAALLVQDHVAGPWEFVCLDRKLALAAELEGLQVLP